MKEGQRLRRMGVLAAAVGVLLISPQAGVLTGLPDHMDRIVIGSIIPLVPGYSLTTAIRDFFNSDYLSGLIHLIDALLIAFSIAVGVGIGIKLIAFLGGGFVF